MIVAKKNYYEHNYVLEEQNSINDKNIKKRQVAANKKFNALLKVSAILLIGLIAASMILVLLRYTEINETKYNINVLNKEINTLENDIQQLKADLDSLTRSDVIETKAINELYMQYPKYDQMVFLQTSVEKDYIAKTEQSDKSVEILSDKRTVSDYVVLSLEKLYSLLD